MTALQKYLFSNESSATDKQFAAKRRIVAWMVQAQECALADVAKALDISIPTATKLMSELVDEGAAVDLGKVETAGGRRPNLFGVRGEGVNLLGVEIKQQETVLIITDLAGNIVAQETLKIPAAQAPQAIADFLTPHCIAAGIAVPCRVNPAEGRTFGMFDDDETPFGERMAAMLKIPTKIDTIARAACGAERRDALYIEKAPHRVAENMLYINIDNEIIAAVVIGGRLYMGHSGFAGDIASGTIIEGDLQNILKAARRDDPAAVAQIEAAANRAGREIAALAGVFNPELVVVGGELAQADDYLMLPLQASIHRNMAKIIYRDMRVRTARVTQNAAAIGATLLTIQ